MHWCALLRGSHRLWKYGERILGGWLSAFLMDLIEEAGRGIGCCTFLYAFLSVGLTLGTGVFLEFCHCWLLYPDVREIGRCEKLDRVLGMIGVKEDTRETSHRQRYGEKTTRRAVECLASLRTNAQSDQG